MRGVPGMDQATQLDEALQILNKPADTCADEGALNAQLRAIQQVRPRAVQSSGGNAVDAPAAPAHLAQVDCPFLRLYRCLHPCRPAASCSN